MSTRVIHGVGKPRIVKVTDVTYTRTVASGSATTIEYTTGFALEDDLYLKVVRTVDDNGDSIYAIIQSHDYINHISTVDEWIGGDSDANVPAVGATAYIEGYAVDLPYCGQLIERFRLDAIQHKLANGNINTNKRGWYYSATLDYSNHLTKEDFQTWGNLLGIGENDFWFYPRRDNPDIYYRVTFPEDFTLEFAQKKHHINHKLVIIELIGTRRITSIDLTSEPGETFGYGQSYASGMYLGD